MLEKHCFGSVFNRVTSAFWYGLFNKDKKRSSAFTLTEMLIALVVIAVLAVLILPVVTTRAQNKSFAVAYESQVKQLLNSLIGLNVYENVPQFQDTMMYAETMPENFDTTSGAYIRKYMKVTRYCGSNNPGSCFANRYSVFENNDKSVHEGFINANGQANGNVGACALLKNGVSICLKPQSKTEDGGTIDVSGWLDLNGPKGPNVFGRDLRTFRVNMNDRIAFAEEAPDVVITPGPPADCVGSDCVNQNECLTHPASEECCSHKNPAVAGQNDPCCIWHMNPNNVSDHANYLICNPEEEPVEMNCQNETITFGHRCCFNQPEGSIYDPVCCGPNDDGNDYCCKVKFGNSLKCCQAGLESHSIVLTANHPCCNHQTIFEANLDKCMAPCKLDEERLKDLGADWRKGVSSEQDPTGTKRSSQLCCDTYARRQEIVDVGPEDSCCMYEDVNDEYYNPVSADLCCRWQRFPKVALNGRSTDDIAERCCSWRFTKKDLNGVSFLRGHDYYTLHGDSIYNDGDPLEGNGTNKFDSCCHYALTKVNSASVSGVWASSEVQAKVWQNCCSLASLSLPEITQSVSTDDVTMEKKEYTKNCCHFFVKGTGTKYGFDALQEIDPRTDQTGVLRQYCCALDEFKNTPQCCSSHKDGYQDIVGEYREVCCMPNNFYGMTENPHNAKSPTNATGPSAWCCVNGGANIQGEGSSYFYSKDAKFKGGLSRYEGCCNMGDSPVPSNIKEEDGSGPSLNTQDKWQVNCCGNRWVSQSKSATQEMVLQDDPHKKYPSAEAFTKGCCTAENAKGINQWDPTKDDDLLEDCCLAYGSETDKSSHSRNDELWYNNCCQTKNRILPYEFYFRDSGCCKNVHWWIPGDSGAPDYVSDTNNCCKAALNGRTNELMMNEIKGVANPDTDWLKNCCKYVEDYEGAGNNTGYQLYVTHCCENDRRTEHDGNRKRIYGGTVKNPGDKHTVPEGEDTYEKHCCDINIAHEKTLNSEGEAELTEVGIPGQKCCWEFLTADESEYMRYDFDRNALSEKYRGYCCKAYGNESTNPLTGQSMTNGNSTQSMRELIELGKAMTCPELWICGLNGTDLSNDGANPLNKGNTIGYGLPGCCKQSRSHNNNINWKKGCCEFPRYYETNVIYRETCCNGDYVRDNPGDESQSTDPPGLNNSIPFDWPNGPANVVNDNNAWAFCCEPDAPDPKVECCKWFQSSKGGDNYKHNNEYHTKGSGSSNGPVIPLSNEYQIACCNKSSVENSDLCSTCGIRWETGLTKGKVADAYGQASDSWQYYNFSTCCKDIFADDSDLTVLPGKVSDLAKDAERNSMWLNNCCAYVGNTTEAINNYYKSHEIFRAHCCIATSGPEGEKCANPDLADATPENCHCWYDLYNEIYWDDVSAAKKEQCCLLGYGGTQCTPDTCSPMTTETAKDESCCNKWKQNGQLITGDIKTECCKHAAFAADASNNCPCTNTITISDEIKSTAHPAAGVTVLTIQAHASKEVTANVTITYQIGKKQCVNGVATIVDRDPVTLTIPQGSKDSGTFMLTIDASGLGQGQVKSQEWIKSSTVSLPSSSCPVYSIGNRVSVEYQNNTFVCCATVNTTNANEACCNEWYDATPSRITDDVKSTCCALGNKFHGKDESYCCPASFDASKATGVCCNKWANDGTMAAHSNEALTNCCGKTGFGWNGTGNCCPADPDASDTNATETCCNYWLAQNKFNGGAFAEAKAKCCERTSFGGDDHNTVCNISTCPAEPENTDKATEQCCGEWLTNNKFENNAYPEAKTKCCTYANFGGENHDTLCGGGGDDTCSPISKENATAECCQEWWTKYENNWDTALWNNDNGTADVIEACCNQGVGTDHCCNDCAVWRLATKLMSGTYYDGFSLWAGFGTAHAQGANLNASGKIYMTCTQGSIFSYTASGDFDFTNGGTADININFSQANAGNTSDILIYPTCSISGIDLTVKNGDEEIYSQTDVTELDISEEVDSICKQVYKQPDTICTSAHVLLNIPLADACDTHTTANANTICCNKWAADSDLWTSIPYAVRDKCCADVEGLQVEGDQCTCIGGFSVPYNFESKINHQGQANAYGVVTFHSGPKNIETAEMLLGEGYSITGSATAEFIAVSNTGTAYGDPIYVSVRGAPGTSNRELMTCGHGNSNCSFLIGAFRETDVSVKKDGVILAFDNCGMSRLDDPEGLQMLCPGSGEVTKACHWVAKHPDCEDYPISDGTSVEGCACWMGIDNQWSQLNSDQKQSCCALNHNENRCLYDCADRFDFSAVTIWDYTGRFKTHVYVSNSTVSLSDIKTVVVTGTAKCMLPTGNNGAEQFENLNFAITAQPSSNPNFGQDDYYTDNIKSQTGSNFNGCYVTSTNVIIQYKTDQAATASSSTGGSASGSYSGGCWPRPKTSFNDSIKYAMNSAKDKFFAKAPQTTEAKAPQTTAVKAQKPQKDRISVNHRNHHMYINGVDTGIVKPSLRQTISAKFYAFRQRIADNFRAFIASIFDVQISSRKPHNISAAKVSHPAAVKASDKSVVKQVNKPADKLAQVRTVNNVPAAKKLTNGKYQPPAMQNTIQGGRAWADDTLGEEANPLLSGIRQHDNSSKTLASHCCTPNHPKPSKFCCEVFYDRDWKDFDKVDGKDVFMTRAYKSYCCQHHNICPKRRECKPEYADAESGEGQQIFDDCMVRYEAGKWNGVDECCACLRNNALNSTEDNETTWKNTCCQKAAGKDKTETDGKATYNAIALTNAEFKSVCCNKTNNQYDGTDGHVIGLNNDVFDERCCNYIQDKENNVSSFCCAELNKKQGEQGWSRYTSPTDDTGDIALYRNQCCVKNVDTSDPDKYCSCKQMYDKYKGQTDPVAALKASTFGKSLMTECCANLYANYNAATVGLTANKIWEGTCCQNARTKGNTVFDAAIKAGTDVNTAFRNTCCAGGGTGSDGSLYGGGDKDERCCNYTSTTNANAFCCEQKAKGLSSENSSVANGWNNGNEWGIEGNGNEAMSASFRLACCRGNKVPLGTDPTGNYDGNDAFCTCEQLYNKYTEHNGADLYTALGELGDDVKLTCCKDLYANKGTENRWKQTCCPVAQSGTKAKTVFGKATDALGNEEFRLVCCNTNQSDEYYSCYTSNSSATGSCQGGVDSTSNTSKDWRCCTGNISNENFPNKDKYTSTGMPTKNANRQGSGNRYCCYYLGNHQNDDPYKGHTEGSRAAGCCKPEGDEGVRYGNGNDPQCCSYIVDGSGVTTHDGRTAVNNYCCKSRQSGLNTAEGAVHWSLTNGNMTDNFRTECCKLLEDPSNNICTCDYYYNNQDWTKLKQATGCCTALFKYDSGSETYNYTGASQAKNADGTMKDDWKTNCCRPSFKDIISSTADTAAWQNACCDSESSGVRDLNNVTPDRLAQVFGNNTSVISQYNSFVNNTNFGCCTWRWNNGKFDTGVNAFDNTSTVDKCCGPWASEHAKDDSTEDEKNLYFSHCCTMNSGTFGCCKYMKDNGRTDQFSIGSPCCQVFIEEYGEDSNQVPNECRDVCERYYAGYTDYYEYDSSTHQSVHKSIELSDKQACCSENLNNGNFDVVKDKCCFITDEDDDNSTFFIKNNDTCCDLRANTSFNPTIYYYTLAAYNRNTCEWGDTDCSAYNNGSNWYCGNLTCAFDASNVNQYCCDMWISNGEWGKEGSDYTIEDACCKLYENVKSGKCRQVCSITNQEEVWADVQVSIDVSSNLGYESNSTCRYTLNVTPNDGNTIETGSIWAHLGKLSCAGFTYGGQDGLNINESGNSNSADVSACYTPASAQNSSIYGCPSISGMEVYEPSLGQLSCDPGTYNVNCKRYGGHFVDSECTDWVAVRPACFEYRNSSASLSSCGCWMNDKAVWNKMVDDYNNQNPSNCCNQYNAAGPEACSVTWDYDYEYGLMAEWLPNEDGNLLQLTSTIKSYNDKNVQFSVVVTANCTPVDNYNGDPKVSFSLSSQQPANYVSKGRFDNFKNCGSASLLVRDVSSGHVICSGSNSCNGYIQSGPNYEPKKYTSSDASDGSVRYAMKNTIDKLFAKIRSIFAMIFFPNNVTGEAK